MRWYLAEAARSGFDRQPHPEESHREAARRIKRRAQYAAGALSGEPRPGRAYHLRRILSGVGRTLQPLQAVPLAGGLRRDEVRRGPLRDDLMTAL